MYGLKVKRKKIIKRPQPKPITSSYFGKAGEYGVFSELLFWNFNPAMVTVDDGIDIVAFKDKETSYNIQVKTSNLGKNNAYSYTIDIAAFERNNNAKTFYIFVVRRTEKTRDICDYIIFPSSEINRLINIGHITKGKTAISVSIRENRGVYNISGHDEIADIFINDFSVIN
jgi:hypothetical protein